MQYYKFNSTYMSFESWDEDNMVMNEERSRVEKRRQMCFLIFSWQNWVFKEEFQSFSLAPFWYSVYLLSLVPSCSFIKNERRKEETGFCRESVTFEALCVLSHIRQLCGEIKFLFYSRTHWDAERLNYLSKVTW